MRTPQQQSPPSLLSSRSKHSLLYRLEIYPISSLPPSIPNLKSPSDIHPHIIHLSKEYSPRSTQKVVQYYLTEQSTAPNATVIVGLAGILSTS